MLKHVTRIKDFGVFDDFKGAGLPDFATFNLIFGWNYSGKTTFSRVFQCVENGALHEDYEGAAFSILTSDGNHWDQSTEVGEKIRVYNEDFRKRHLQWDEANGFQPIILLGEENIELWLELEKNEEKRLALEEQKTKLDEFISTQERRIGDAETRCARHIVNSLPIGRFDKRGLTPIIKGWKGIIPPSLATDIVEAAKVSVSADVKDEIVPWEAKLDDFANAYSNAVELLSTSITSETQIDRLVENPDIANWVEAGRDIHRGKSKCEFCENPLSEDRVRDLDAHFSDAFEELKGKLSSAISSLKHLRLVGEGPAFLRASFYKDMQHEFTEISARFKSVTADFNSDIDRLISSLELKFENPFDKPQVPERRSSQSQVEEVSSALLDLVERANERTKTFDQGRTDAIELLKGHLAAEEMREIKRFEIERQIDEKKREFKEVAEEEKKILEQVGRIQRELSNAVKGADAVNETLASFFGKNDIQLRVTENDRFLLMRGDKPAQNLSEGEKSAIAFCYFITKLREDGNKLSETIVYIDDPISSLDSNHLLHLAAFIKSTFYQFHDERPKHRCLAKQLFISTHNHEFFHLIYDWLRKMKEDDFQTWMIERRDTEAGALSALIECPKSITEYRSEYLFLYKQLKGFVEDPKDDASVIFNVGNMARRLVEGYCAFKFLEKSNIEGSLSKIIADPVELERARKFMHFYSHTLTRGGGAVLPDMSEAVAIVRNLLVAIEHHDPVHFASLEAAA